MSLVYTLGKGDVQLVNQYYNSKYSLAKKLEVWWSYSWNGISRIMSGQRNISRSIEGYIYTVPQLTRIIRVVGDHVPKNVRFSFCRKSISEMTLLSISIYVNVWCWYSSYEFWKAATYFSINNSREHARCSWFNFYKVCSDRYRFIN